MLRAEGVGAFSYTHSVVCYLIIFSNLGINAYASRKMSTFQDSEEKQNELFWQIIGTKLINFAIPCVIYALLIICSPQFSTLFVAEIFFLIDGPINISWYYTGMENFKSSVRKGLLAKIVGIILLFLFVKDVSDIYLYALIMGGTQFFSDFFLWIALPRRIKHGISSVSCYKKHFIGGIKMLMPELASSVFTYGDKIMLGLLMVSTVENGYYEQSQKIISLSQGVINAIATVMLPRIANLYSKHDQGMVSYYMNKTMSFLSFIGIPTAFGISAIAKNLVPWFFGNGFESVEVLL